VRSTAEASCAYDKAMCANYVPVTAADRLLAFFGVERDRSEPPHDVFPVGLAPFIRLRPGTLDELICDDGVFGMLPHFATEVAYGRRTYNARTETVAKLASFRHAWAANQRCVIPAETLYEPSYETGKAVRWRISLPDNRPMGIAGLYREWTAPDGHPMMSFTMLTVNADEHPVMKRFHKPGDEKRMVVILEPDEYLPWLTCSNASASRFFKQYVGPMVTSAAPLPPRVPRADSRVVNPPQPDDGGDLFSVP